MFPSDCLNPPGGGGLTTNLKMGGHNKKGGCFPITSKKTQKMHENERILRHFRKKVVLKYFAHSETKKN